MKLLGRKTMREGVQQRQYYPEPWFITDRWWLRLAYRGLLGRPMDGVRWTNSTFWRSASEGEDHAWLRLAGWHRALIRVLGAWLALIVLPLMSVLALFDEHMLMGKVLIAHLAFMVAPAMLITNAWFMREHGVRIPWLERIADELTDEQEAALDGADAPTHRELRMRTVREGRRTWELEVVRPVAMVAASVLDVNWRPDEARRWVDVPHDYLEPGGGAVEIMLPKSWTATEQKRRALVSAIKPRLNMLEVSEQWLLSGRSPRLLMSAPPVPPTVALFRDYERVLMSSEEYRPFLGVVAGGEMVAAEMVDQSPHMALSAGTGAGKSMLMRAVIMQALHWGWCVVILDWKVTSHAWARGLPGVRYVSDEEDLHDMCVTIGQEVDTRKAMSAEELARQPKMLVVREEWNIAAAALSEYWSILRSTAEPEDKKHMPVRSPALSGVMKLDFAGRAFGMFDFLAAQRMSNRVFNGNVDLRENFQIRMLARYTMQTWKLLVPDLKFIRKPKQLGAWIIVAGEQATLTQALLITDDEAREFATNGVRPASSPWALAGPSQPVIDVDEVAPSLGDQQRPVGTRQNSDHPELDDRPAPIILKKLSDISVTLEYLGITEGMLRKAARSDDQGDPDFPAERGGNQFKGYLYDLGEVTEWAHRKRATEAARIAARKERERR